MNRKNLKILLSCIIVFVGLVTYNYFIAQKKINETRPSPLGIYFESFPERVILGQSGAFIWNIDSSPDLSTTRTTIYWGYDASPSALTMADSPEAVNYPFHQEDYYLGVFALPDTFDLSINFNKQGKVYFRGYAKVGDNHLWTEEKSLDIISSQDYVN